MKVKKHLSMYWALGVWFYLFFWYIQMMGYKLYHLTTMFKDGFNWGVGDFSVLEYIYT